MSAEIATLEKVNAAVAQLHKDGKRATADAVIASLGGGSKPTVLKHMKALREEPKVADSDVPAGILDLARPILAQIFAEGGKAEAARNRDQIERLHRMLGDLEAEVEALAAANLALEGQVVDIRAELGRTAKALSAAEEGNATKDRRIEELQAELTERDATARQHLADTLAGFDERLASLVRQMEKTGAGARIDANRKELYAALQSSFRRFGIVGQSGMGSHIISEDVNFVRRPASKIEMLQ